MATTGVGLRPIKLITGAPFTNQLFSINVPFNVSTGTATDFAEYDPVGMSAGYLVAATADNPSIGVFMGCEYIDPSNNNVVTKWIRKGTLPKANMIIKAAVCMDPYVVYLANCVGTTPNFGFQYINTMNNANYGNLTTSSTATTNQFTGESQVTIDITSVATTSTRNVKFLGLYPQPDNNVNTTYNMAQVMINSHYLKAGTTGQS